MDREQRVMLLTLCRIENCGYPNSAEAANRHLRGKFDRWVLRCLRTETNPNAALLQLSALVAFENLTTSWAPSEAYWCLHTSKLAMGRLHHFVELIETGGDDKNGICGTYWRMARAILKVCIHEVSGTYLHTHFSTTLISDEDELDTHKRLLEDYWTERLFFKGSHDFIWTRYHRRI
jgi:hypothetical protein